MTKLLIFHYTNRMLEYLTEALVLDKKDSGEADGLVYFYTEELGRVTAKARSIKKIISKSNSHLEPVHFVKVRLVAGKNGNFQVIDTMSCKKTVRKEIKNCPDKLAKYLRIANFIKESTFDAHPDLNLWKGIKKIFSEDIEENLAYRIIIKALGFDSQYAACNLCKTNDVGFFYKTDQSFLCGNCASNQVVDNSGYGIGGLVKIG